jgi:hypothetical protein
VHQLCKIQRFHSIRVTFEHWPPLRGGCMSLKLMGGVVGVEVCAPKAGARRCSVERRDSSRRRIKRVRYNLGTTEGEISGERTCKRRSAKHLEFLPSLLERNCSIRLSYGRTGESLHSKAFLDRTEGIRVDIEFLCVVRGSRFSRLVQIKPLQPHPLSFQRLPETPQPSELTIRRIVACCVLFPSVSSLPMKTLTQGGVNNGSFKN